MGSLSNLYISSSFQSLLHFGSDNTASVNLTEIQDGFGNGLGFYLNSIGSASLDGDLTVGGDFIVSGTFDIEGKVTINDNVRVNGNLEVSGSTNITGGLVVTNDITASNINVLGTLTATKLVTIIESASVIFSSGSNILGDEISDTQTLIGSVIISGSEALTGSMGISGDLNVGGSGSFGTNLKVYGEISSSTINGIGNVTTYSASVQSFVNSVSSSISGTITTLSQSVDSRLDFLEGPFSTSVDARLDELENWSSSLQTNFVTTAELTQTASFLQNQINQKLNTSSFNSYTQSTAATIATLATTGSNNFVGNQTITGSLTISSSAAVELNVMGNSTFSGSVRGQVIALSVVSQTASMDLSLGNFFTLTLPTASVTYLNPTNIQPGETVQLLVSQQSVTGSLNYSSVLLFPTGSQYSASVFANSQDVLSFVTFNTASIYAVSIKNLV